MADEKRLIDANALIEDINILRRASKTSYPKRSFVVSDVLDCIYTAPTVAAVEVVHSRWVNIATIVDGLCLGFCENCRTEQKAQNATALKAYHKYCRWCGAKMDGGNEDG